MFLLFGILYTGCLSSTAGENAVRVEILEKNLSPSELGECTYRTTMAVTNNGTMDIHALSIIVEIYDPGAQKVAAQESLPLGDLRSGETRNAISILQAHCRLNYTLRAYARY
ncbi:MAG: hypothetical protein LUO93_04005 [Methanomicrobiales archaeon]|nr:hypothetical protein [Methanomicrobiales archaeon]